VDPTAEEVQFLRGRVHVNSGKEVIGFEPSPFFRKRLDRHPRGVQVMDVNGDKLADVVLLHSGTVGLLQSRR
jgi:hypothetical protein